eukprot:TRINITY_DN321_c0_g1_i1.p1 TRINITY_DN321_c0_g1~~TRINITY_DN321_c0_g1_i1.p1  ORF type:complete len:625 (+),score=139.04 TRINITY_DN321_c0_g1_i1:49-1923(+)
MKVDKDESATTPQKTSTRKTNTNANANANATTLTATTATATATTTTTPSIALGSTSNASNAPNTTANSTPNAPVPSKIELSEDQRICDEYQLLLDKSQQLFTGLRDLPAFGAKQWQPYFQKTFETYTKLWKFQQQHRNILENKERYGLKRWEIGEIASKIGQLYYHYYLRTSDTTYLKESYVFYEAIRQRGYFRDVLESKSSMLMVKKLRYYARFIVVSLLLNKKILAKDLMAEFQTHVDDYTKTFKPADAQEWQLVLHEITTFIQADQPVQINDVPTDHPALTQRLQDLTMIPKPAGSSNTRLRLEEAILVGNHQNQVKFSELTIDMFRMLQSLERDFPMSDDGKPDPKESESERLATRRYNPKKHLLYRPSATQFLMYLSSIMKDLPDGGVLLVHLSADSMKKSSRPESSGFQRGLILNGGSNSFNQQTSEHASTSGIYPEDILPFTRKPLFLIVDSELSSVFKIQSPFGQPFLSILSPAAQPPGLADPQIIGNIFTLFLSCPILALCMIAGESSLTYQQYEACATVFQSIPEEVVPLIYSMDAVPSSILRFMEDDFLQQIIIRFIVYRGIIVSHRKMQGKAEFLPECHPPLPAAISRSPAVTRALQQLAGILHVPELFDLQ